MIDQLSFAATISFLVFFCGGDFLDFFQQSDKREDGYFSFFTLGPRMVREDIYVIYRTLREWLILSWV